MHIPFCAKRCAYCDFNTEAVAFGDPTIDAHIEGLVALLQDAKQRGLTDEIKTIYLGGGTPSYIGAERLQRLFDAIDIPVLEFTVEANPDSVDSRFITVLKDSGVNRISLGVQSFSDQELVALGRIHNSTQAVQAIKSLVEAFENTSIDLISGIPEQTVKSLLANLQRAVSLEIPHISVYPLTLESDTELFEAVAQGKTSIASDDEQAELLEAAADYLEGQGYEHYEIASYAHLGYQSRHNRAYWTAQPYLGLGRGAVGMYQAAGSRYRYSEQGIIEELDPREQAAEDLMLRLRLLEGAPEALVEQTCQELPDALDCLQQLIDLKLLEQKNGFLRFTKHGWLLGNEVFRRIWGLVA
jgi:oxygen-independent coproporphyrinogen-3 oxidase